MSVQLSVALQAVCWTPVYTLGLAICDTLSPPWEEDGVGAQQNQDSGNVASPLGLVAGTFGKLAASSTVTHSLWPQFLTCTRRGVSPALWGWWVLLLQVLECSILSCLALGEELWALIST